MKRVVTAHARLTLTVVVLVASAAATAARTPEVVVVGRPGTAAGSGQITPQAVPLTSGDPTGLLARLPGGAVSFNGQISGQAQYRGMFGPRVNVRIDGARLDSAGPNWMDPPLHYLPPTLLERLELHRGIAPVASGSGIGGHAEARSKTSRFASNPRVWVPFGELEVHGHSADEGVNVGGIAGAATDRLRFHVLGAWDEAGDYDYGGGTVRATRYERGLFGAGGGVRLGGHELALDWRRINTGKTGTPSLPMDIVFFRTDLVHVHYSGQWHETTLSARLSFSDIDHRMSNFALRPAPDTSPPDSAFTGPSAGLVFAFGGTDRRFVDAMARGIGYALSASRALAGGELELGVDGHAGSHDATVFDPDFALFAVQNFHDADVDRHGFYGQWRGTFPGALSGELGVRYERVAMSAGAVTARILPLAAPAAVPPPLATLLETFNGADRSRTDHNVDAVAKLAWTLNDVTELTVGFARKVRSPTYVERFLWVPLEVNSGLGDGNNYLGNLALDPEVSYQVELGLEWRAGDAWLAPRAYYRDVDGYIDAVPLDATVGVVDTPAETVSRLNGDATPLGFANVGARFWGFDADFGLRMSAAWRLNGTLSFARGERDDGDPVFRIAAPSLRLGLTREGGWGYATVEGLLVARQGHVSRTHTLDLANPNNTFGETPGYVLVNVFGEYRLPWGTSRLVAGIGNIADVSYRDAAAGFNRVTGSDVARGRRLPGVGRNAFARLITSF